MSNRAHLISYCTVFILLLDCFHMHQCTTSYFSNKSNNRTFSPLLHFILFCNTCCKCNEGCKFKSYPYSTIFREILTICYQLGIKFQAYLHTGYRWSHSVLHFYIWQPVVASTRLEDKKYEELTYCVIIWMSKRLNVVIQLLCGMLKLVFIHIWIACTY